jgi:hypothetical protein
LAVLRPETSGDFPRLPETSLVHRRRTRPKQLVLELLAEDSRLNVYAGKLEVRPPGAPTILARRLRRSIACQASGYSVSR